MSQPVKAESIRTVNPVAAGVMMIVAACLLIVVILVGIISYPRDILWRLLPVWLSYLTFDALAVVGGILAMTRTRLLFAVFGASLLIPSSVSYTISVVEGFLLGENITLTAESIIYAISGPVALVLLCLSLVLLAQSKPEFR